MKMTNLIRMIAIMMAAGVLFAASAQADSVKADFLYIGIGQSPAGFYHWQMVDQNNYDMPVDANDQFTAFCMEYDQHIPNGPAWYEVIDLADAPNVPGPMGSTNAFKMRELFGRHYSEIDTNSEAVSFHHAIWNISVGRNTNDTLAKQWLDELQGPGVYLGELAILKVLHNDLYQDQVFIASLPDIPLVPLPTSALAGMSMLSSLGLMRVIKRKRA